LQKIFPAFSTFKYFEKFLKSDYEIGVSLETHIGQLINIKKMAEEYNKKIIYHVDLIHGLKNDDYGTEYLCQEYKPFGVISTKSNVIYTAQKKGVMSIQRIFLLDSHAVDKSLQLVEKTKPDFIEVIPGAIPSMIAVIKERTQTKILAGGLIRNIEEVENALSAGAKGITTSKVDIWDHFK